MKHNLRQVWFTVAVLALFTLGIGRVPLWSSDEGRFGEKAREILVLKDWIVPHFNYMVSIEKPVLAYWLTAISYSIFGVAAWTTRLMSVMAALLGLVLCHAFVRRLFTPKTANWSVLVLATSIGYVLVGRFAVIDMLMTLLLSGALFSLMTASIEQKRSFYLLAYVFMGFAFLTKGLIGILLPGLVFFVFLLWTRNLREILNARLGWGILILTAIIAPWFWAIQMRQPDFFNVFIIQNHFSRFAAASYGRKRPLWFFVPVLFGSAFPWSFFLPASIAHALHQDARAKLKSQFLICWIAVIFIFFSLPKSKLPYYLLPVSVPLAVLVAAYFSAVLEGVRKFKEDWLARGTFSALPVISLVGWVGMMIYLWLPVPKKAPVAVLKPLLIGAPLMLAAGTGMAYRFFKKERHEASILSLAGTVYTGLMLTIFAMIQISPFQSSSAFAEALKPVLTEQDVVAVYASPDRFSDLPFYLQRRILVVGSDYGEFQRFQDDARYGEEMKKWFVSGHEFAVKFNAQTQKAYCLMELEKLPELKDQGLGNYTVVKELYDRVLITNQPGETR